MLLPVPITLSLVVTFCFKGYVASPTPPKVAQIAYHTLARVPSVQNSPTHPIGRLENPITQAEVGIHRRRVRLIPSLGGRPPTPVQGTLLFKTFKVITLGLSQPTDKDVIAACLSKIGQAAGTIMIANRFGDRRAIGFRVGQFSLNVYAVAGSDVLLVEVFGWVMKWYLYLIRRWGAFLGLWQADFLMEGRKHVRIAVSAGVVG